MTQKLVLAIWGLFPRPHGFTSWETVVKQLRMPLVTPES